MSYEMILLMTSAIFAVAALYSSVGHGGGSGYILVMTLFGLAPEVIKPTALTLNIFVATIGMYQFHKAGHFSWKLFWPFVVLSAPLAFLGGKFNLPPQVFKMLLGAVLLCSAAHLVFRIKTDEALSSPSKTISIGISGAIGLLSGLTGTGGGIFLTPVLLFMRWAKAKQAAAVSAAFILVNSISGLLGNLSTAKAQYPNFAWYFLIAAIMGGVTGSYFGSNPFSAIIIKRCLAVVLTIAGVKLLIT
jgi:hypothetical protein